MPEITIPAVDVPVLSEPSYQERMNVWLTELAELADFFRRHHREENVAIITGDFNMSGANVREYAEIRRTMDKLNMQDLWAWDVYSHNPSQGDTCRFTDGPENDWDRDFRKECAPLLQPGILQPWAEYCDDRTLMNPPAHGVGRYDYIFVERPNSAHHYKLEVSRALRRPFKRAHETDNEIFLSDHLGLDLTLYCSSRDKQ